MDLKIKNFDNFINSYQILSLDSPLLYKDEVFFISENEKEKNEILKSILLFNNLYFNQKYTIYYNINSDLIYNILNNKNFICILTLNDLFTRINSKNNFIENIINLQIGQKAKITNIISGLINSGYEYNHNINIDNNNFKNYGDIIEIKINDSLYKVEFFENKIDKIYTIDPNNKKRIDDYNSISIIPSDQFLSKSQNVYIDDYINNNSFFVFHENIQEDLNRIFNIEKFNKIIFCKFLKQNNIGILENYNGNFNKIKKDFFRFEKKYILNIISFSKDDLIKTLYENNINLKNIDIKEIKNNINFNAFIDYKNNKIFLCDNTLFKGLISTKITIEDKKNNILKKQKNINRKKQLFISEIKDGDYVVHIDHGIGIFSGIEKNKISDNLEKEYAVIIYEGGDKLFVPVESIDRIDKYIGKENPTLHRLSESSMWINKKQRIKENIFKYAGELLDISAKRAISKIKPMEDDIELENQLKEDFKYIETKDQIKAINDVFKDLKSGRPMDRLICGDVGFGKTEIAIRAAFKAVLNGYQVMILCPTTILSQQHFDTFSERLNKFGIKIVLLNRFTEKDNKKNNIINRIKSGEYNIIIGTHRLLSKDISFDNLGLIIIDEEQKFGSITKERLKKFRNNIHVLTMSATPIPRTLNMSLTNIINMSIISTPPQNRLNIKTIVEKYNEDTVRNAINYEISRGGQVYYLYNKVETINICEHNLKQLLPHIRFAVAHGQMESNELLNVFHKFDTREIDVLICTTIIENGIDLPNVNTLIIENAERFGLAQLHQLRGRVGRSNRQAYAYFLYKNENMNINAEKRLETLETNSKIGDGFRIASRDMEIRGIGNILGEQQHGYIYAIGLNLYSKLLEQAVNKIINGVEEDIDFETKINLPINFNIPENIICDKNKRIYIYQKLAAINNEDDLKNEMISIFKNLDNKNIYNLYDILILKLYSKKLKIKNIEYNNNKIILDFDDVINEIIKNRLIKKYPNTVIKEKQIKIDKSELGYKWLDNLISLLKIKL